VKLVSLSRRARFLELKSWQCNRYICMWYLIFSRHDFPRMLQAITAHHNFFTSVVTFKPDVRIFYF
jgi:hypothetical protein